MDLPLIAMLTCEFGYALKRNIIDYHGLRASLCVHCEQDQSVGAARLDVVQHERYRWPLQIELKRHLRAGKEFRLQ